MTTAQNIWSEREAPSLDDFEAMGVSAFAGLPQNFRTLVGELTFAVAEFPEDDVLEELEAESPFDILGLFEGVGLAVGAWPGSRQNRSPRSAPHGRRSPSPPARRPG